MTNPIVSNIVPSLYAKHTKHLSRAQMYTYNYAVIDDYIVENFGKRSLNQMAKDLNEYFDRIQYRYQVLSKKGLIVGPRKRKQIERQIEEQKQIMAQAYEKYEQAKAKLDMAVNV